MGWELLLKHATKYLGAYDLVHVCGTSSFHRNLGMCEGQVRKVSLLWS